MEYTDSITTQEEYLKGRCEVCGYYTFKGATRDNYDICDVCYWEDDGFNADPDAEESGPNQSLSINQAKANYKKYGACQEHVAQFARRPLKSELHE